MTYGAILLFFGLLQAAELFQRGGEEGAPRTEMMPWPFAVPFVLLTTIAGTFMLTRGAIAHHWISN